MTKIAGYKIHPAAALYPMLPPAELQQLADDIAKTEQRFPVILTREGLVLDGRNRLAACELAGLEPKTREWDGEGSEIAFIRSVNERRRHLTPSQAGLIAIELVPLLEKEARDRQRAGVVAHGREGRSTEQAAQASIDAGERVSPRTLQRAKRVLEADPAVREKIRNGELTFRQAEQQVKRAEQLEQIRDYVPPVGTYPVIFSDPPWPYDDKLAGVDRELPYPTATIDDIRAMAPPAADDCTLYLATTNSHLPVAFELLKAWGFEYRACVTWAKDRIGMGRWVRGQTEHMLIASKGKPVHLCSYQSSLLSAPRGANSEKPDEMFALIESLSPAQPRLEMYARKERPGWVTSGSELPPVEPKPPKHQRLFHVPRGIGT